MRISKSPEDRKQEIIDTAYELFLEHTFEKTSVNDIVKKIGIAQGTFYYYFKSKDEVLDAVINHNIENFLQRLERYINEKNFDAIMKFQLIIGEVFNSENKNKSLVEYVNRDKSSALYRKTEESILKRLIPILIQVVQEGVSSGLFETKYPKETVEMLFGGMGYTKVDEQNYQNLEAMQEILERTLGAKKGSFQILR